MVLDLIKEIDRDLRMIFITILDTVNDFIQILHTKKSIKSCQTKEQLRLVVKMTAASRHRTTHKGQKCSVKHVPLCIKCKSLAYLTVMSTCIFRYAFTVIIGIISSLYHFDFSSQIPRQCLCCSRCKIFLSIAAETVFNLKAHAKNT